MNWFWHITGGRPMRKEENCIFVDRVSGKSVHGYRDRFGRAWLAEHSMAMFRVSRGRENKHAERGLWWISKARDWLA